MKKLQFLSIVFIGTLLMQCSKSSDPAAYKCSTCNSTPDAVAANDASTKGVYKGVVIGSSGTIKFNVANSGSTITAVLIIDGTTVNLTSTATWTSGQAFNGTFTGTLNGAAVTISLYVGLNGVSPSITNVSIPGHAGASISISKETSTGLIECFEGKYSTTEPESGTFNIVMSRTLGKWAGASRKDGATSGNFVSGTISNGQLFSQDIAGSTTIGTLSSDQITGSFKDSRGVTITINGKRTL